MQISVHQGLQSLNPTLDTMTV